jgi:hypothetical protein
MLTRAAEAKYIDFDQNVTSNTVVNNVAADYSITFSTDVSDNIVESNGAVRLSHGSREQTD